MIQIKKGNIGKVKQTYEAPKIKSTDSVVLELWVRAGGRCEFHGCNTDLLMDELTTNEAKIAHIAHIVARTLSGPRGGDPLPIEKRNEIDNLMLICPKCHVIIDNKKLVKQYPKELLKRYKKEHESRIKYVTSLGPEYSTVILRVIGDIRGDSVSISKDEIRKAVIESSGRYPRYLGGENHIEIDLTGLPRRYGELYWKSGVSKIDEVVEKLVQPAIERKEIDHLSVFALARIPFLIHLGYRLGDKVPTTLYHKHRDGQESWTWKRNADPVTFRTNVIRSSHNSSNVALILSISGSISLKHLPSNISSEFFIYEISPKDANPGRDVLKSEATIYLFRKAYHDFLRHVEKKHMAGEIIHLFPAIPAQFAIVCGRELLKDVSPGLLVYEKQINQYCPTIKVN